MKRRDLYSSLFFLALGIGVCIGGWDLGIGQAGAPGSGFLPFSAGLLLAGLSIALFSGSIRADEKDGFPFQLGQSIGKGRQIIMTLLSLGLYAFLMNFIGFLFSTFLFMLFIMRFVGRQGWMKSLITAILVSATSHFIFAVFLDIQLPEVLPRF
jgi:hypothetical protein